MNTRALLCCSVPLVLAACGSDSSALADGADEGGGDTSATGPADESSSTRGTGTAPTGTATSDPDDSSGGALTTDNGGDSSGDPGAQPEDFNACEGLACGGFGVCLVDEDGPYCECQEGYAAVGLTCIACDPVGAQHDVEIGLVDIELVVTIDGMAPPPSEQEDGNIVLRGLATGDEILVGSTHDPLLVATVVPGAYDVYYEFESGGELVPINRRARIREITADDLGASIPVEIGLMHVTGSITVDKNAPNASPLESGRVWLRDPATGDSALLGDTHDAAFAVNVIPGEYDVRYEYVQGETVAKNRDAWVGDADLQELEVVPPLEVDITTVALDGTISFAGMAPSASPAESGRLVAVDTYSAEEIVLGATHAQTFETRLVAGNYDLYYERVAGGEMVPVNKHAYLANIPLSSDGGISVDIPVTTVSGSFRIDGLPAPTDNGDDGVITLRSPDGEDVVTLGNTHEGTYERLVIPGAYDVYYHQETVGAAAPLNTHANIDSVLIDDNGSPTMLEIEVSTVDVAGTITINGSAPPDSEYEDGRIYLRNLETEDSVLLGSTRDGAFAGTVVAGVYDVVYVVETAGAGVPVNSAAVIDTVDVAITSQFDVDVPSIGFSGNFTVEGATPPGNPGDRGLVLLEDVRTGDVVYLGDTNAGAYAQPLAAGTYVVYYHALASTGLVPFNPNAGLACIELSGP